MRSQNTPNSPRARSGPEGPLARIYAAVDSALFGHGCEGTTECCRFGITGREPYVTPIEVAYLKASLRKQGKGLPGAKNRALPLLGGNVSAERACPLLQADGKCAAYEARPFGCRTFFCERRTGPGKFPKVLVRELLNELSALSEAESPGDAKARPLTRTLLGP